MNLKNISDNQLLRDTKKWAEHERVGLHAVLHHLYEVDRRRLFCSLKYQSLFAYAVGELKYAEDAAVRRISAMRLMRDLPEIAPRIADGSLSLTNLGLAKRLFSKKAHSPTERVRVLQSIENKTSRVAQKIVFDIMPELKRRDVGYHDFDDALRSKLEKVRGMLAHREGELSLTRLLDKMCDQMLAQNLPAAPRMQRQIRFRDQTCVNCGSGHALEVDHIIPRALGGGDQPSNLRLLCRSCNQRAAIVHFGASKMQRHLRI